MYHYQWFYQGFTGRIILQGQLTKQKQQGKTKQQLLYADNTEKELQEIGK